MIFPIFIRHDSEPYIPPRCPQCDHALPGWEPPRYSIWDNGWFLVAAALALITCCVAVFFTLLEWLMPFDGHPTLWEVIKGNVSALLSKRMW